MQWMILSVLLLVPQLICAGGDQQKINISCLYGSSCILPSTVKHGASIHIQWDLETEGRLLNVHSFYDNRDQLQEQDRHFHNRTSLVDDPTYGTTTALMLKDVNVKDEGTYKCLLKSDYHNDHVFYVVVKVYAPIQRVDVRRTGNSVTCSSEGIYPQPELTLSTQPPSNGSVPSPCTVQQDKKTKLYKISCSLKLSDGNVDLPIICIVSTPFHTYTSIQRELRVTNRNWAQIPFPDNRTSFNSSNLVCMFNHTDVIFKWNSTGGPHVSPECKEHVRFEGVLEVLYLQNLSSDQEGTYTCFQISAEETTAAHTVLILIKESSSNTPLVVELTVALISALGLSVVVCIVCRQMRNNNGRNNNGDATGEVHVLEMEPMNSAGPEHSDQPEARVLRQ